MNFSASSGATSSGLFVFCDWSHCCSNAATDFSVPVWACNNDAVPNESKAIKHTVQILFIEFSLFVAILKPMCEGPVACVQAMGHPRPGKLGQSKRNHRREGGKVLGRRTKSCEPSRSVCLQVRRHTVAHTKSNDCLGN